MSPPCIVGLCKNIGTRLLPSEETRRAQWIQAIEHLKPGLTVRKYSRICSAHFKPTDFCTTPLSFLQSDAVPNTLKKTAVPSVFPWQKPSQECPPMSQDQDLLTFNFTKVKATYARTPRVTFVEEHPYLSTVASDFTEDPLNMGIEDKDQTDLDNNDDDTGVNIVMEKEVDIALEFEVPLYENLIVQERLLGITEKNEKPVQTQDETYKMEIEESRTIQKSTQKKKLQNLLCSELLCGLCFESDYGICIDVEFEIVGDEWSHRLTLGQVFNSVFHESTEYLASKKICNNCTNELIRSYKFIQNSKFTSRLLNSYVNDFESKTEDLFTHLKDIEMESNVFIILENEHEGNKSYFEDYKYLTKIKEEQETNHKKNINSQYILPRYKVNSKTKCRLCDIILRESEIKNHLRVVHEESVFLCKICSEVFYTSGGLEMHANITHAVLTEKFQCVMCLKDIEDNHEHICEFKCPECNEPSCIHYVYLINYREKVLKESMPKCLDCDYVCRNKEALISHVNRYHLNHRPYTCDKCAEKFHSKTVLRAHYNSHKHTFTCEFCNLNLFSESSLAAHKYLCKDVKRENTCKECPANFDSTEELLEHGKFKHTEVMSLCNGKFLSKPKRELHSARVHSEVYKKTANSVISEENYETKEIKQIKLHAPSKFLCKICNIEYDSLRKLGAHNRKHVGPFSTCHFCKKQLRKALFQKHIESHGVVSCNKCDKSFENITLLKYHQKSHLDDVQCPKCNLMMNPGKLTRHVKSHAIDENPHLKEDKKQKPNIECELCDYITWNSILLECHMNRYHLKIKPYVCHICSKNFIGKHLLKKHLKYHTSNQSVICTICGKKLANSSCLKSHLKLHTGEKNYPCDVCGQRFRSSSIMNVHKVKKHLERDVACPLCSSKFHTLVELRRHVVKTHWKKDTKFDPRELNGLENHYHLFHDGRRIRMDDHDVDFYLPC